MNGKFKAYAVYFDEEIKYIGVTAASVKKRWYYHVYYAINNKSKERATALGRAIRKHGVHRFRIEHIASSFSESYLCDLEVILITQYSTYGPLGGYNMTTGGKQKFSFSLETRNLMSVARMGRIESEETLIKKRAMRHTPEAKANMSKTRTGRKLSIEHVAKTVAFHTGRKRSVETCAKISAKAKCRSLETRKRMSEAQKGKRGRKRSPEEIAATMSGVIGKPKSLEHRAKLRDAALTFNAAKRAAIKPRLRLRRFFSSEGSIPESVVAPCPIT